MAKAKGNDDLVTPAEAVQEALQWHREGRLAEAEVLYERVLAVEPDNAEALHFLGLLHHQLGATDEGIGYVRGAVTSAPGYAAAHSNLGNMLLEKGDLNGAERAYRRALELMPDLVDAKNNLGLVLRRLDRPDAAEQAYREAIAQEPEHPSAYSNLGHLLAESGRLDEAIALLERAVWLNPEFAEAFHNLGKALSARNRPEEATVAYGRAVELGANAYVGLATSLRYQGLIDEAIAAYRKAIAIGSRQAATFYILGMLLSAKQCDAEAIEVYEQWLQWDPDNPVAQHMLTACRQQSIPPRAPDAYVEAVFDGFAPAFDRRLSALEYRAPELAVGLLKRELGDAAATRRILDAGCGTGLCGPLLRPYAGYLAGVDLSRAMLELAEGRGSYDKLVKSELTAFLEDSEDAFDIIVCVDTLVYFGDLKAVLLAVSRALTRWGFFIATLERAENGGGSGYRLNNTGRYSHSGKYLETVFEECNLRLRSIETEVLRQEKGQPVLGLVVCASAGADPQEMPCAE